jgi:hypothetical protein
LDKDHPAAQQSQQDALKSQRTAAQKHVAAQNAAETAQVEQQAVEDRISENQQRNKVMSNMAFATAQTGGGGPLGRGMFRRRRAATKISDGFGALASVNSGDLKNARLKTLKATQAADITRTNPVLGYNLAMSKALGDINRNYN